MRLLCATRLIPGVADRILELLPRAGIALLPATARVHLDGIPLAAAVLRVVRQTIAVAIDRRVLVVGVSAVGVVGVVVVAEIGIVGAEALLGSLAGHIARGTDTRARHGAGYTT